MKRHLRKLIKYEEHMGVNTQQDDYYESLFRRTTASFRAKHDKENLPKHSGRKAETNQDDLSAKCKQKTFHERQGVLQETNRRHDEVPKYNRGTSSHVSTKNQNDNANGVDRNSLRSMVEDIVTQILQEKFKNSPGERGHSTTKKDNGFMDDSTMRSVVQDLVNKILREKLYGGSDQGAMRPLQSIIEEIVNAKLKETLTTTTLAKELTQKLNISKDKNDTNKSLNSEALLSELLAEDDKPTSSNKQRSTMIRSRTPEWEKLGDKENCEIKRLPRPKTSLPEWQETNVESKHRSASGPKAKRSQSPAASSTGRSSSRSHAPKGTSVLIPRSVSQGRRTRKPTNSDPVALYQYYKNEWEYFRRYIPGETNHNCLRWHIRQRFLDPE